METLTGLLGGFQSAISIHNLITCLVGVILGTITGVLPGIGGAGTMALLLPLVFGLPPDTGLIMLAGIFYGAAYGGSTTAILVNIPGEGSSVVTCIDGYQMARKGRAGAALAVAAIGSFIAGTIGLVGLMLFAPMLARAALAFGPQEFFALAILGLLTLSNLTGKSMIKALLMVLVGIMLGSIGIDQLIGYERFTFGMVELERGIELVTLIMGLYGISEVLRLINEPYMETTIPKVRFRDLYPNREEICRSIKPMLRGGILGFFIGLIPGPSGIISTFISYGVEKRLSKHKDEFGKGAIEGVAGPESANNSACMGSMVPLLALGLPFTAATALFLAGLQIHGITPGPLFIKDHTHLFWVIIASMYIGNFLLLILNLPLVGVFASIVRTPIKILVPVIILITFVGAYSINNSVFDLWLLVLFGVIGLFLEEAGFDPAPLVIGVVLGPILENGLRQGLSLTHGHFIEFLTRPISGSLLMVALLILGIRAFHYFKQQVKEGRY